MLSWWKRRKRCHRQIERIEDVLRESKDIGDRILALIDKPGKT